MPAQQITGDQAHRAAVFFVLHVGENHGHDGGLVNVVTSFSLGVVAAARESLEDLGDARAKHGIILGHIGLDERQGDHRALADLLIGGVRAQEFNAPCDGLLLLGASRAGQGREEPEKGAGNHGHAKPGIRHELPRMK